LNNSEPFHALEMGVERCKRHVTFQRYGGYPDVILRDDLAFSLQCYSSFGVLLSGGTVRIKQRCDLEEIVYLSPVLGRASRLFHPFIKFAESDERQEKRFS
jgi:hypothetical protein